jgi:hypothetical protein
MRDAVEIATVGTCGLKRKLFSRSSERSFLEERISCPLHHAEIVQNIFFWIR